MFLADLSMGRRCVFFAVPLIRRVDGEAARRCLTR